MDTIRKLLCETNHDVRDLNNEIGILRTLFSKWKIHAATRKDTTGLIKENDKVTVDVDPEIISRVERALQLVSRCKPQLETNPQKNAEISHPATSTRPVTTPRSSSISSASKTSCTKPSVKESRTSGSLRDQRAGISRGGGTVSSRRGLPPVVSKRPSNSSRARPAHQTAPFKTDYNISSAHYRRVRPGLARPPAPPRPSQSVASTRLHSGVTVTSKKTQPAAVAKKWMDDGKPTRRQMEREEVEEPSKQVSQRLEEAPTHAEQGDIAETSMCDNALLGEEIHRGELRRSLSMESMQSPRETEQCEEPEKFIFSKFIKCVPIPMKLKREIRHSRRLLLHLLSSMRQGESVSAKRFLDRLEDSNAVSNRAKLFHCLEIAKEVEKRFWIFDQVLSRIELSRMTAEQARWCWQWLFEGLERFAELQTLLQEVRDLVWRDYEDDVENFLAAKKGSAEVTELTPVDVYNIVGIQRVNVHYSKKKDLHRYMDKLSHLHKMQQTLRIIEGLKVELGDLKPIVKNAENPATAYRQLSGLLINRFPVMIFDDG